MCAGAFLASTGSNHVGSASGAGASVGASLAGCRGDTSRAGSRAKSKRFTLRPRWRVRSRVAAMPVRSASHAVRRAAVCAACASQDWLAASSTRWVPLSRRHERGLALRNSGASLEPSPYGFVMQCLQRRNVQGEGGASNAARVEVSQRPFAFEVCPHAGIDRGQLVGATECARRRVE